MKQLLTTLLVLCATTLLHAGETFTYPADAPVFEITYPANWEVEQEEQVITAGPASGELSSVLMAIAGEDVESAIEGAEAGLNDTFAEYTLSEPSEGELNGLPVLFFNGKGQTPDGVELDMGCAIFTPNGETFFMIFIFTNGNLSDKATGEMNSILQSVKAL